MTTTRAETQEIQGVGIVPDAVAAIARKQPERPAIEVADDRLTYGQLLDRASRLAGFLRHRGVGRESLVAICMERSAGFVTAMLGTMLSGGAFLPLDPGNPTDRLLTVLRESASVLVLADEANAGRFEDLEDGFVFVLSESAWKSLANATRASVTPDPHDLAYVIYTSGSTGVPKGVEIEHGSLAHVVAVEADALDIRPSDRCLQFAAQGFDALQVEVWPTLMRGATLVVVDEEAKVDPRLLQARMVEQGITSAVVATAMAERLLRLDWPKETVLRNLATGGAALRSYPREDAPFTLQNEYGPTECTIDSTRAFVAPEPNATRMPSIGVPLPGVHVHLVGPDGREVAKGEQGEMWIAGANVGRGYRHRPDLTAEKFADDPFGCPPGTRLYKSGDLVRWSDRGDLEFIGRTDDQVKLRGFRIEPAEIALTIGRFPEVEEVSVQVRGQEEIDRRLVGYIVVASGATLDKAELDARLRKQLPAYMVPSAYVFLDSLPLTVHGKVDVKALPDPEELEPAEPIEDDAEPVSPAVAIVSRAAAPALGVRRLRPDDNFFELGAHSLFAATLVSRIEEETGIELAVRDVFERPTPAALGSLVEERILGLEQPSSTPPHDAVRAHLDRRKATPPAVLGKRPEGSRPVLSPGQEQIWLHEQFMTGLTAYNESLVIRRGRPLEIPALERTLDELVRRHEVLRTSYPKIDGGPVPVVHSSSRLTPLPIVDLRHLSREEAEREASRLALEDQAKPFDLAEGPLLRAVLCRIADDDDWLLLTIHMIVFDALSVNDVLLPEMELLYEAFAAGRPSPLPEPELQYLDYAYWRRNTADPERRERDLAYWRGQLEDVPRTLDLPLDHPRPSRELHHGAEAAVLIEPDIRDRLAALAESEGTTMFVAVMAAYGVLLQRYSGQDDVVVGTPVSVRGGSQTEHMMGMFLNTLPVRVDLRGEPSFRELLRRLRDTMLDGLSHADLPFQDLLSALHLRGGPVSSPLFQAMFVLEPRVKAGQGWTASELIVGAAVARHDLNLQFEEHPEGLVGRLRYDRDLFEPQTAAKMVDHLVGLMRAAASEPEREIGALPLDPDGSIARRYELPANPVVLSTPADAVPIPVDGSIAATFESVVRRQPDRLAMETSDRRVTYGELDEHANAVARAIVDVIDGAAGGSSRGEPSDSVLPRVALLLGHDATMLAGLFGALKAGVAYVPLDPYFPAARSADVVADSEPVAFVTDAAHLDAARVLAAGRPIVDVDAVGRAETFEMPPGRHAPTGEDIAYILYTSGSTGRPKGVVQRQRNVLGLARAQAQAMAIGPQDRMTLVSRYTFDGAAVDIFSGLLSGASLHPIDMATVGATGLAPILERARVTVYHSVPTVFRLLVTESADADLSSVRLVILGGEASRRSDLELFQRRFSKGSRFVDLHGATEVSVDLHYVADASTPIDGPTIPVGWPYEGIEPVLLDPHGRPTEVRGELAIRSDLVALGYWRRDDLTSAAFSTDAEGRRMYRTGDLAFRRTDGSLEYLGRRDLQVKLHGLRVEIGEIETVLSSHPLVRECAVTAMTAKDGGSLLAAHIVPAAGESPTPAALHEFMARRLPEAMIPGRFRFADSLPKTSTGKTDRRALGEIEVKAPASEADDVVDDELVRKLTAIWSAVLGTEVRPHDNFFDLGGHSLLAVRLLDRVERETGHQVPLATLLEDPTVAHQAELIHRGAWDRSGKPIAVRATGSRPPLFVVPGAGSRILYMHALARHLDPEQPLYVLNEHLRRDDGSSYESVPELAAWYIKSMKSVQPSGPYRLAGYSYGGHVAYEVARQLAEAGEDVALLAIIDTRAPGYPLPAPGFHPSLLPRRIANQLRILQMLGPRAGLNYLHNRALIARDRLTGGLWERADGPRTRWLRRFLGSDPVPAGEREWVAADGRAGETYRPAPYPGRIVFLWPVHNQRPPTLYDTREGWDKLATAGLDVRPIAGSHLTVLVEPLVRITAKALADALSESTSESRSATADASRPAEVSRPLPANKKAMTD